MAVLASVALLLVAIGPVAAAPAGSTSSSAALAEHAECNLTVDAEGTLYLDGEALAGAELAAVNAVLAGSDVGAAIELAAAADADVCLNLEFLPDGGAVVIDGHIDVCGPVTFDGQGVVINGVSFQIDLNGTELGAFLDVVGAAGLELCASITVTSNAVAIELRAEVCATVTLNANETVTIAIGDLDFDLLAASVEGSADLEVGAAVDVGIIFTGGLDLTTEAVVLEAVIDAAACTTSVIILEKQVTGTGFDPETLFNFSNGISAFQLGIDNTFAGEFEPGNFTITETLTAAQLAEGFSFVSAECDDDSVVPDLAGSGVNLSLQAGETITCVFTNAFEAVGVAPSVPAPSVPAPSVPAPSVEAGASAAPALPDTGASPAVGSGGTGTVVTVLVAFLGLALVTYRTAIRRAR
jgi:hypothetical protein